MPHQRPEDLWTRVPEQRAAFALEEEWVAVVWIVRAVPALRAAEAAEAQAAQGPPRLESLESDPLRGSVEREVGQDPASRLRKRVLGAFREWGSGKTHLNPEPLYFYL